MGTDYKYSIQKRAEEVRSIENEQTGEWHKDIDHQKRSWQPGADPSIGGFRIVASRSVPHHVTCLASDSVPRLIYETAHKSLLRRIWVFIRPDFVNLSPMKASCSVANDFLR